MLLLVLAFRADAQPHSDLPQVAPRTAASDYLSSAKAGPITIGAEFKGHNVPTPLVNFTSEDFVVVELALYGAAGEAAKIAATDFSLKVNGKVYPSQQFGLVMRSLKDPEWEASLPKQEESKGGIGAGGGGGGRQPGEPPPPPPKMPFELMRAMQLKVQRASLPEGERQLPVAGLLYFPYRGKSEGIKSLELVYAGSAGKTSIPLEP